MRAPHRGVARRVAQPFLLLVRRVVLLVDDDEAQVAKRHQHREARAEHDMRGARLRGKPRGGTLALVEMAMRGGEPRAGETARDLRLELRREPDLGHEEERLAPARERVGDDSQVHLRLAAAGHAMKEDRMECARLREGERDRGLLLGRGPDRLDETRRIPGDGLGRREGAAAHLAQARRQRRTQHLTQRTLVVARAEIEELELGGAQRGHVRDHRFDGAQALHRERALVRKADDHSHLPGAPERHHHEASQGHFLAFRDAEIERVVERNIDGDFGDSQE